MKKLGVLCWSAYQYIIVVYLAFFFGYLYSYKCLCQRYWLMGICGNSKVPKCYRNDFKHDLYCCIWRRGGLKCPHKIHLNTQCEGNLNLTVLINLSLASRHFSWWNFGFEHFVILSLKVSKSQRIFSVSSNLHKNNRNF